MPDVGLPGRAEAEQQSSAELSQEYLRTTSTFSETTAGPQHLAANSDLTRARENSLGKSLTIILPALNEEDGIVEVLGRIPRDSLRRQGINLSVALLDGGSRDRTRDRALQNGARVFIQSGRGKGSALREFLPALDSDYCVILDSDASYPPEDLSIFVQLLLAGIPAVVGSRFRRRQARGAIPIGNFLGNQFLNGLAHLLYQMPVSDVCSGMWGFKTEVLKAFNLTARSFDIEADFFAECSWRGVPIAEVPIKFRKRIGTPKLRWRAGLRIASTLLLKRIQSLPVKVNENSHRHTAGRTIMGWYRNLRSGSHHRAWPFPFGPHRDRR